VSKSVIQIPNEIIRNEGVQLNAIEFVMLLFLKKLYFLSGNKDTFEIDPKKLMCHIGIGDNRTFKKIFGTLYENGFILEKMESVPRGKPLVVKLNISKLECKSGFTQLPTKLLDKANEIGCVGVRLLYYYESYINRKNNKVDFCYASYETITSALGIGKQTVSDTNQVLVKCKYLKITKHQLGTEYKYNNDDVLMFEKWNNHYDVKLDKIKK
jgi:hypothetical protein